MSVLAPREAYRRWAPAYQETATSFLDEELAQALSPPLAGKRLLDAGCGTGLRLKAAGAALAVGIDASPEMLAEGQAALLAAADVRALPFADGMFDVIWCRLVLGYLADPGLAYRELVRVCSPGGYLFVSDFHADATAAGHKRNFRDGAGVLHEIENYAHDARRHAESAAGVGFTLVGQRDAIVGPSIEAFYIHAGRHSAYSKDRGLALVAGFLFQRQA